MDSETEVAVPKAGMKRKKAISSIDPDPTISQHLLVSAPQLLRTMGHLEEKFDLTPELLDSSALVEKSILIMGP